MRGWLRATAGGLPSAYWYLWAGLLINRLGGFAVLFLSLYLTTQRGAGAAMAGLIVGTYGIGGVIGTLAGGVLADRWGRRRTLVWSHLACAVVLAGLAFAGSLGLIAALCALMGLAQSMPGPAFVAAIIDLVPAERRLRAFNLEFWAFNLGTAGASLVAGVLAEWSYTGLFLLDAASALAAALIIAARVPETLRRPAPAMQDRRRQAAAAEPASANSTGTPGGADARAATVTASGAATTESSPGGGAATAGSGADGSAGSGAGGGDGGLRAVLGDRIFLAFAGLTLLQALVYTQSNTIVPLAMRDDGLSPSAYGLVVAVSGALIVIGQLFVPRLIDNRPKARVLAAAQAITAVGFGVIVLADHLPVYLAAAVIWTVGSMLAAPPNAAINSELAPAALRGRYQAVFYLTFPAAAFLAPALGGASLQYLGSWHWLVVEGVGLVAAALHLAAGPSRERHAAAIRSETATTTGVR